VKRETTSKGNRDVLNFDQRSATNGQRKLCQLIFA